MDPKPSTIPKEQGPKILSFEEFSHRNSDGIPRYENFYLHFAGEFNNDYQTREYYLRFASKHKNVTESLCDKIQNQLDPSKNESDRLKPFEKDLYEAYKIMRSYGVSDEELFS